MAEPFTCGVVISILAPHSRHVKRIESFLRVHWLLPTTNLEWLIRIHRIRFTSPSMLVLVNEFKYIVIKYMK